MYVKKENFSYQLTALLQNNRILDQTWKCFFGWFFQEKVFTGPVVEKNSLW